MYWFIAIISGYLLGSIHFCRILGILFKHVDIVEVSPDHNPGAANAFWYCGKPIGIAGLILDLLKGFLPVFFSILYLDITHPLFSLVILAPVFGHAFSIFNEMHGGKCISAIFGELAALLFTMVNPYLILILGLSNIYFAQIHRIAVGNKRAIVMFSILLLSSIPICTYLDQIPILVGVAAISLTAMFKHLPIYAPVESKKSKQVKKNV